MRSINKKSLIALMAAALLLVSSVSIAVAYFSDTDQAAGSAQLNLSKETRIDEGPSDTEKQIDISNTGTAAIVVRVTFFGPDKMEVVPSDNWVEGTDGWYYFKYVLQPGDNTGNPRIIARLKDLTKKEMAELGNSLQVTIVQEAEFATYTGSAVDIPADWGVKSGFAFTER